MKPLTNPDAAADWDRRYSEQDLVFSAEPTSILVELAGELPPGRALDLGAGEGRNTLWLAQQGWQVTAVDFSRAGLAKAERRARESGLEIRCIPADLREYRPPVQAFDLVLIAFVHPLPAQRPAMFSRAAGAVTPGGHLLAVGRDLSDCGSGYGGPSDPQRRYTPERLAGAFPGLRELRRDAVRRPPRPDEEPPGPTDTVVWCTRPAALAPGT
ncbi:MAG TPA: class I SAM-dependent methyltransferase [Solirubrobacteraceae bacterium]|nr:class I SAM-dependent methyltransferase [Solirubrobacteraceae bacterium]